MSTLNAASQILKHRRDSCARRLRHLKVAAEQIPGWAWGATFFVAMFFAPPAWDSLQYLYAARAWPDPFAGVPLIALPEGGYYGIFLPWAATLFLPLAPLPPVIASATVQTATIVALYHLAGRDLWKTAAVCLSPVTMSLIGAANLDAIAAAGALLSGSGAIVLLMMKPQVAAFAAIPIVLRDGWKHAILPAAIVALATLLWPEWIGRIMLASLGERWNWSLFPLGLPPAILLLVWGCKRRDPLLAALATPLATPYIAFYSYAPALAVLFRRWPRAAWVVWVITWIAFPSVIIPGGGVAAS